MLVERREQVIAIWLRSTGNGRNPMFSGRRQPSCGGTSRISREAYVRFCERLGVKFPGPTRQSRRTNPSGQFARCLLCPESGQASDQITQSADAAMQKGSSLVANVAFSL